MSFLTVCRWVREFSTGLWSVTYDTKSGRSKSASSPKIVKSVARCTSEQIVDMASKASAFSF